MLRFEAALCCFPMILYRRHCSLNIQTPGGRIISLNSAWCVAAAHDMYVSNAKPMSIRVCIGDMHIVSCRHDVGFSFEARA